MERIEDVALSSPPALADFDEVSRRDIPDKADLKASDYDFGSTASLCKSSRLIKSEINPSDAAASRIGQLGGGGGSSVTKMHTSAKKDSAKTEA